jgi:hypothetical protein
LSQKKIVVVELTFPRAVAARSAAFGTKWTFSQLGSVKRLKLKPLQCFGREFMNSLADSPFADVGSDHKLAG